MHSKHQAQATIPVALFAYNRADLLEQTLGALRAAEVPLLYAFSDGPREPAHAPAVAEVRAMLRAIDWCTVRIAERPHNLGLGQSIRAGVAEVLDTHESLLVVEDDLICVPETYRYLSAALRHYRDEERVMSVTGWTHPRVTPAGLGAAPYFDGRAECLFWGTWRRAWAGMDQEAPALLELCRRRGIDTYRYGADLPAMAAVEQQHNIWAVRWLLLHLLRGGLCLRPPRSMVEHIGFDARATNADDGSFWGQGQPLNAAPLPARWPEPRLNRACARLWQAACGRRLAPLALRGAARLFRALRRRIAQGDTAGPA